MIDKYDKYMQINALETILMQFYSGKKQKLKTDSCYQRLSYP